MSCEAYGSLHIWAGDAGELAGNHRYHLQGMAGRLQATGYYQAARDTREILRLIEVIEKISAPLAEIWHAVDRVDSGDNHPEEIVVEAAAAYVPYPPPPEIMGQQKAPDPSLCDHPRLVPSRPCAECQKGRA